jgi:hypothetical protein
VREKVTAEVQGVENEGRDFRGGGKKVQPLRTQRFTERNAWGLLV